MSDPVSGTTVVDGGLTGPACLASQLGFHEGALHQ